MAAVLVLCFLTLTTAYAEVTQEDIDAARDELENLQNQKDEAEDAVTDYTNAMENLENDLSSLNGQMQSIVSDINELEKKISNKEQEIDLAAADLQAAEEQAAQQYGDMKHRIQFMYENSTESVLTSLFGSESITELLNRAEYIAAINTYDRNKLTEFEELQKSITEEKEKLESEKTELLALRADMKEKQDSVNKLINTTKSNLANAQSNLTNAMNNVADLEEAIREMEEYEQQLEEQKAKEDAARLAALKAMENEDTSGVIYIPSESDLYLLGAIIQCESDGEPYEGKLAVGSVVMNRVKSSYFPNTISGVIYQSGQFSPVASGRYAYRLENGVNKTCLQAAQEVLDGNITTSCLFFRRNNGIIEGTVIGNHVFY